MTAHAATAKNLAALQTEHGAFAMLALDQRESLRGMFARTEHGDFVGDDALVAFKAHGVRVMSPHASAVLLDRPYCLANGRPAGLADNCGLIAAADVLHQRPGELMTHSTVDPGVTIDLLHEVGADAVKFLILWRPGQPAGERRAVLDEFWALAESAGVPTLLEGVVRTDDDEPWSSPGQRHDAIFSAAEEFATYRPDMYKAEVPGYVPGDTSQVAAHAEQMTRLINVPWVVLSNGVEPHMFVDAFTESARGGASGFLAGRAIWQDIVTEKDIPGAMTERGTVRLDQLRAIADAPPRAPHPRGRTVSNSTTQGIFIDGVWRHTQQTARMRDAWTGEHVADAAVATAADAALAVDAADRALRAGLPIHRRAEILNTVADWILNRSDQLADLVRMEVNKPISAARGEVARAAQTFRFSAQEALRLPGETVRLDAVAAGAGTTAFTIPEPRGIVAAITPFNFPVNLSAHKIGPAIAAGCPVVYKPAQRCPLSAGALVRAFEESGLPAGFLNLVTGPASEIVDVWQADRRVAVVNFTGSPAVGWSLKAASPEKLHILELGAASAMVVHADADLERAADDAATAGYACSGQICISLQRLLVHRSISEDFLDLLSRRVAEIPVGDPREDSTVVSALITQADAERLEEWTRDAEKGGARVLAGGTRTDATFAPTLLADTPTSATLMHSEAFGPVVAAMTYDSLEEAISMVNDCDFGLNTSIYTQRVADSMAFARGVQTGQVLVNLPPTFRTDNMPYGGVKSSGQGVEGVKYAVAELTHQKLVVLGP